MSRKKPSAVSNAHTSSAVLWGEVVAAGAEDVSGTDDTGTAGQVSPGLSLSQGAKAIKWHCPEIRINSNAETHTLIMCFWSGEEHSNQIKMNLLTAGHSIIFFHANT